MIGKAKVRQSAPVAIKKPKKRIQQQGTPKPKPVGFITAAFEQLVCGLLYRDWARAAECAENKCGTQ